jgi:flagella basal body P-ring formation protein FlgA
MLGKALENGSRGQRIRVRNLSSGREISGEVIASGVIQVGPSL